MKKIKKAKGKTYEFIKKGDKYQKKLIASGYTIYDRSNRVLEVKFVDYLNYQHVKTRSLRTGVWQIKKYLKKPYVSKDVYKYKGDKLVKELFYMPIGRLAQMRLHKYNKNGKLIYLEYFWINGEVIYKSYYKYDEKGRKIEWVCHNHDLNDKSITRYYYDKKDRIIAVEDSSDLDGSIVWKNKYDKNDNIIEENHYDGDGNLEFKTIYTYNEKGQKIKREYLHQGTIREGFTIYERDEKGNLLRLKCYNSELKEVWTSEYNKYGHEISTLYVRYDCDCTGVKEIPYQIDVQEYEYY